MIILTDVLVTPFDEGAKVATNNLVKQIKLLKKTHTIAINSNISTKFVDHVFALNKLLFSFPFYHFLKKLPSKEILYIPKSSITLNSFIRAKLLNIFTGKSIHILSVQPRKLNFMSRIIVKSIKPESIIVQSKKSSKELVLLGLRVLTLPLGVDGSKFYQFTQLKKRKLREKYNISPEKTVLLHVGHIKQSRNISWLIDIKKQLAELEIIIVGSTYTKSDKKLIQELEDQDIRIIKKSFTDIETIYNLADFYIFPVLRNNGAIETPLSVLEAMACNLPIITTRFGNLPDLFKEDEYFHFVKSSTEIIKIIQSNKISYINNRKKVGGFTWKNISLKLIEHTK